MSITTHITSNNMGGAELSGLQSSDQRTIQNIQSGEITHVVNHKDYDRDFVNITVGHSSIELNDRRRPSQNNFDNKDTNNLMQHELSNKDKII